MTAPTSDDHDNNNGGHKTRGFMRAVGGLFHRRSARGSESRNSTLDAPPTATAVTEQSASAASSASAVRAVAPEELRATNTTASASAASSSTSGANSRGRDANNSNVGASNKVRAAARHVVRNPFRKKSSESVDDVLSSSKDSVGTAPSDDDDDGEPAYACQFLFYPGSAEDNSFKPDKVHSTVVEIDYNAIRPSLTLQMPVFFSPPKEQTALRRSSILTDPREYEL